MKTITARSTYGKPVTKEVRDAAIARGRQRSLSEPHATALRYLRSNRAIELDFADRTAIRLPIEKYPELAALTEEELSRLELGFGGSVLCLDERDLHVSIAGLVAASKSLNEVAAAVRSVRVGSTVSARLNKGLTIYKNFSYVFNRIDLEERFEVQYWTNALGVSEEQLKKALKDARERQETKPRTSGTTAVAKKAFGPT